MCDITNRTVITDRPRDFPEHLLFMRLVFAREWCMSRHNETATMLAEAGGSATGSLR
jgi:hypothetical protein